VADKCQYLINLLYIKNIMAPETKPTPETRNQKRLLQRLREEVLDDEITYDDLLDFLEQKKQKNGKQKEQYQKSIRKLIWSNGKADFITNINQKLNPIQKHRLFMSCLRFVQDQWLLTNQDTRQTPWKLSATQAAGMCILWAMMTGKRVMHDGNCIHQFDPNNHPDITQVKPIYDYTLLSYLAFVCKHPWSQISYLGGDANGHMYECSDNNFALSPWYEIDAAAPQNMSNTRSIAPTTNGTTISRIDPKPIKNQPQLKIPQVSPPRIETKTEQEKTKLINEITDHMSRNLIESNISKIWDKVPLQTLQQIHTYIKGVTHNSNEHNSSRRDPQWHNRWTGDNNASSNSHREDEKLTDTQAITYDIDTVFVVGQRRKDQTWAPVLWTENLTISPIRQGGWLPKINLQRNLPTEQQSSQTSQTEQTSQTQKSTETDTKTITPNQAPVQQQWVETIQPEEYDDGGADDTDKLKDIIPTLQLSKQKIDEPYPNRTQQMEAWWLAEKWIAIIDDDKKTSCATMLRLAMRPDYVLPKGSARNIWGNRSIPSLSEKYNNKSTKQPWFIKYLEKNNQDGALNHTTIADIFERNSNATWAHVLMYSSSPAGKIYGHTCFIEKIDGVLVYYDMSKKPEPCSPCLVSERNRSNVFGLALYEKKKNTPPQTADSKTPSRLLPPPQKESNQKADLDRAKQTILSSLFPTTSQSFSQHWTTFINTLKEAINQWITSENRVWVNASAEKYQKDKSTLLYDITKLITTEENLNKLTSEFRSPQNYLNWKPQAIRLMTKFSQDYNSLYQIIKAHFTK
jgi:hypothetical protein